MYDTDWARQVYVKFREFCTRAEQIDLAIIDIARLKGHPKPLTTVDIARGCVESIQGKRPANVWTRYKRLCKRTPFDLDLAEELMYVFWDVHRDIESDRLQLSLFSNLT